MCQIFGEKMAHFANGIKKNDLFSWRGCCGDEEGADLVEEIDGQEDDHQGEGVAGGGDDGSKHEQHDHGVAAIGAEETAVQHAQRAQQPGQQGQLEDDAHDEDEHQEGVHVAVERDLVGDHHAHVVVSQEPQRDRENDKITHGHADKEHDAAHEKGRLDTSLLTRIECRCDKGPQEIQHNGERQDQREPERRRHVYEKLGGKLDVDELDMESLGRELGQPRHGAGHALKEAVEHKVAATGRQDDRIEDVGHDKEQSQGHHHQDDNNAHQHRPQRVDVVPKGHLLQLLLGHQIIKLRISP